MDAKLNLVSSSVPDLQPAKDAVSIKNFKNDDVNSFQKFLKEAAKKEVGSTESRPEDRPTEVRSEARTEPRKEMVRKPEQASANEPQMVQRAKPAPTQSESPRASVASSIDDKAGAISESYDSTAVSYPVSRVAKESLDEKTVKDLKDQDLWNLPTMVMAQPTQQLALMKAASEMSVESRSVLPMAKPIAQFMASLENELGVEPDRLVQAFKNLPAGQLQLAPEKTMMQVVKNLNLSPKDQGRAVDLYSKMLAQMQVIKEEIASPELMAMAAMSGAQSPFVSEKLDENVVKGQQNAKARAAVTQYTNHASDKAPVLKMENAVPTTDAKLDASALTPQKPENFESLKTDSQNSALQGKQNVYSKTEAQSQAANAATAAALNQPQAQNVIQANQNAVTPPTQQPNGLGEDKAVKSIKVSKESKDILSVKGADATTNTSAAQVAAGDQATQKFEVGAGSAGMSGVANQELKADQSKHEAIRSIVNQAQMLAQKGGGEVRMSLKPDHLGEIQLKVAMEGNRVNVQMTTERTEVKKLIEQSVNELRHGLANHNLSMEKLDVSVSNRDMQFSGRQSDFGAARDFSQQFHQQQENRRDFMQDVGFLRGNAQRTMSTMDRASQAQRVMSARNSSGRLNVVA